jgi:osmotically-inducible protein OsmY
MQEAERVQTEIQKVIEGDPTIQDARRILVSVEKQGLFKGEVVVLKGRVRSESDKAKADRIAHLHSAGREVRDSISVVQ